MSQQALRARAFADLHVKGRPVIIFNVWDPGSAKLAVSCGARALATGSWSVAAAFGYDDGEEIPLDLALSNLSRIVEAVELPVSLDFEGAYATAPDDVGENTTAAIRAGAIGFNFEDQKVGGDGLYPVVEQQARIRAMRRAGDAAGVPVFINARTDLFLKSKPPQHASHLDEAVERAHAYAEAGASGFFVPGLSDPDSIGRVCEASPLPVNTMMFQGLPPPKELAALGVARISYGPGPYRIAMRAFEAAAQEAYNAFV